MFTKWWTENSLHARKGNPAGAGASRPAASRRAWARGAAVTMLAVSLAVTSGCGLLPKEGEEEVLPEITPPQISKKPEYEVTTTTLETKVQGLGKVMSKQEETLFFTLDNMRLKTLNVKPGDQVAAGEVIATLDVETMQKDLRSKRLAFRKAEAGMKETLRKRDEMDPIEFEEAAIAFEEQRQAIVDLENEIAKATLTSPLAGTVVQLNVQKGDAVKAYDPVAVIADTGNLVVAATLSKDDLAKVSVGMPAVVSVNNAEAKEGKVSQLPMTSGNDQNGNGGAGGGFPGGGGEAGGKKLDRPEDYLQVDIGAFPKGVTRGTPLSVSVIIQRKANAVVIPLAALRSIGSRTYVQVIDENGKREVDVAVGQQTSTQAEILEGLTPGQKVVGR
ncbi:MAG TPA: HlyD family efflux transporter periplasmic adaptor subunit [Paenibacillus sp.]|uniref:efflux RND transporter periplasmic adaptor subunit n=1 Tax=Paenibacillus sp. TaxID=58172 RepID=UPI0028D61A87|nr:HlyD family efflux transporter periplasmic adaptor subunit [Paenibacillus sp.]HUC93100.1 HlyD family efflux transporter periplasmic adaptor subunit [Paenibacillus sp.]